AKVEIYSRTSTRTKSRDVEDKSEKSGNLLVHIWRRSFWYQSQHKPQQHPNQELASSSCVILFIFPFFVLYLLLDL
ncbi:unnamed protein product, partial [Brassica oleracea]